MQTNPKSRAMKKIIFLSAAPLLTLVSLSQSTLLPIAVGAAAPETKGLSTERLKQVGANINQWIKEDQLNGATLLILRQGKIVYYEAFGYANKEMNIPMKKDNIFRIASMTKPVISVAAM